MFVLASITADGLSRTNHILQATNHTGMSDFQYEEKATKETSPG